MTTPIERALVVKSTMGILVDNVLASINHNDTQCATVTNIFNMTTCYSETLVVTCSIASISGKTSTPFIWC